MEVISLAGHRLSISIVSKEVRCCEHWRPRWHRGTTGDAGVRPQCNNLFVFALQQVERPSWRMDERSPYGRRVSESFETAVNMIYGGVRTSHDPAFRPARMIASCTTHCTSRDEGGDYRTDKGAAATRTSLQSAARSAEMVGARCDRAWPASPTADWHDPDYKARFSLPRGKGRLHAQVRGNGGMYKKVQEEVAFVNHARHPPVDAKSRSKRSGRVLHSRRRPSRPDRQRAKVVAPRRRHAPELHRNMAPFRSRPSRLPSSASCRPTRLA